MLGAFIVKGIHNIRNIRIRVYRICSHWTSIHRGSSAICPSELRSTRYWAWVGIFAGGLVETMDLRLCSSANENIRDTLIHRMEIAECCVVSQANNSCGLVVWPRSTRLLFGCWYLAIVLELAIPTFHFRTAPTAKRGTTWNTFNISGLLNIARTTERCAHAFFGSGVCVECAPPKREQPKKHQTSIHHN